MLFARQSRPLRLLAMLAATTQISGGALVAADAGTTRMAPFNVEAEFGVDGLRIQNSSSVLNQHLLDEHGVVQLQDMAGIAPNLFSSNSDSRGFGDVLSLRGISNSIFFSAPSIALYIDGVPGGSVSSYPSALLNIDSFTVKAGPQGTDYGRNAPGGVIDIRTRAPGATHRGKLQADYGNYNATALQASFDGPLAAGSGYSASLGYTKRDGFIDNTTLKRSADDRSSFVGRGALYFNPTDKLQLRFGVFVENVEDDATRLSSLASRDPFTVASDLNGETKIDRLQFSLQARMKFGWGSVVATTSRQDWDLDPAANDLDLNAFPAAWSRQTQSDELWTQEIRFESAPSASKSQWRAGLFYFDSETAGNAQRVFIVPPSAFVPPNFVQTERTIFTLGQRNLAAYGNFDDRLSDATTLKVGVRLEQSKTEIDRTKASSNSFGFPTPPEPRLVASQDQLLVSASAGLVHAVSDSLSLLARTSLAHKPAGFSAFTANPSLSRFGSERQWANEVGLTFGPPKGRFGGSVLAFCSSVDGYQYERTVPGSTDFVVINARKVTVDGIEAKFMWHPVEHLWLDFQAGTSQAKFEEHRDSAGTNVKGNRVPFIPEYTLRLGATIDLGQGFSANASYSVVGRAYYDERNTTAFAQSSYGLVNAQLRYRHGNWSTALYAQNLTDRKYYQFINPEIFAGSPGAPRRIGVQVSFEY